MAQYFGGIDVGGTKILTIIMNEDREIVGRSKTKTPVLASGEELVQLMVGELKTALDDAKIKKNLLKSLGATFPGPVDFETGWVKDAPNLGIQSYPLQQALMDALQIPVTLENDVNAGIYGELIAGAARGYQHVVGVYPGTGIGGGIIIDGHLYRGISGGAGEVGHMKVQLEGRLCGCGQRGCLEAMASKTAIAKELVHLAMTGKAQTILEKAGSDISAIKSKHIRQSIEAGEIHVQNVVEKAAYYLGVGLANLVNIFNPQLIVLGGGLIEKLDKWILPIAQQTMRDNAMPSLVQRVEIKVAQLEDDSVALGVAALGKEAANR